ncbi:MAG: ABC transporter permease [Elusimicrobia bacterium]|nr:ABC transporter permease [Elusimicrobiota bacterium]
MIKLENIHKTYKTGKIKVPVLRGINLEVEKGEFVSIVGRSGSGKSTLLNILGLLDKPTSGRYFLDGKETSNLSENQVANLRNRYFGFVFQMFNLLPRLTALENVKLPTVYSEINTFKNPEELLKKIGLEERIFHKPNEMSGGEQQRVAIARALINSPQVILADEPTGNLDSKSTQEIMEILKSLNEENITIILITHEEDLAQQTRRIVKIDDGKILEDKILNKTSFSVENSINEIPKTHSILSFKRIKSYFSQGIRSLLSNKTRTFLSLLGISIGVAAVIAMLALGTGAKQQVKESLSSLGSNLLIVRPNWRKYRGVGLSSENITRLNEEDLEEIKKIKGVLRVSPTVSRRGVAIYKSGNWSTNIIGVTSDYQYMRNSEPDTGRFFTEMENKKRAKVSVIGRTVLRELFGEENPIGKFIKINRINFRVIGVLPERGATGWRDRDDEILIPVNTAMYRVFGKRYFDRIQIQVEDENLMDRVSKQAQEIIVKNHRIPQGKKDIIEVRNLAEIQQAVSSTVKTFSYLLGSIALISLLVGGIGIMNIMLVSVTERTREIGLRKALGANKKDILAQFLIESVTICIVGGILGILLGSGISIGLSKFANWNTKISMWSILLATVFSTFVGLFFGIWPAQKAAKLNPVEALRYE